MTSQSIGKKWFIIVIVLSAILTAASMISWAEPSYTEYDLYVERPSSEAGNKYYHEAKYEPKTGAYLAMFAEGDEAMHDAGNATRRTEPEDWYFGGTPRITGKDHAAYMVYVHYDQEDSISQYASHYRVAKERGKAMQICLETTNGLDEVKDDEHLHNLCIQAKDAGIPIFLRFDGEFNDESNPWHKDGPAKYIEKYRIVANAFHKWAPNVAMVWAPNDWPIGSEDAYYPGDAYVDWVGVSSYVVFNENGTPKQSNTWIDRFKLLYHKYGNKKPILITEGAAIPSVEYAPMQDVTESAQYELQRFYAGVARKYPNLKMIFYWSNNEMWGRMAQCEISSNPRMLAAYRKAIADSYYLGEFNTSSAIYYQNVSETTLKAQREKISCYVNDVNNRVDKAVYYVNGKYVGEGRFPDYTATIDFSSYAGQQITLKTDFYNEQSVCIKNRILTVKVESKPEEPVKVGNYSFTDIKRDGWYLKSLEYVLNKGMMNGTSDTTFAPEGNVTRGMLVTILHRLEGYPSGRKASFTDVVSGSWYEDAVNWASSEGIVKGVSSTKFAPNEAVTREQFAAILYRYTQFKGFAVPASGELSQYSDRGKVSSYAKGAMIWANGAGLITGVTSSTLSPQGKATRAQAAAILHRYCEMEKTKASDQTLDPNYEWYGELLSIYYDWSRRNWRSDYLDYGDPGLGSWTYYESIRDSMILEMEVPLQNIGYQLIDLDGNGVKELIISTLNGYEGGALDGSIVDLYTYDKQNAAAFWNSDDVYYENNHPLKHLFYNESYEEFCWLMSGNRILLDGCGDVDYFYGGEYALRGTNLNPVKTWVADGDEGDYHYTTFPGEITYNVTQAEIDRIEEEAKGQIVKLNLKPLSQFPFYSFDYDLPFGY